MGAYDYNWLRQWQYSPETLKKMDFEQFKSTVVPSAKPEDWILLRSWLNATGGTIQHGQFYLPITTAVQIAHNIRIFNNSLTRLGDQVANKQSIGLRNPQQPQEYLVLRSFLSMLVNEDFSSLNIAEVYYEGLLAIWTKYRKSNISGDEFNSTMSEVHPLFTENPIRVTAKDGLSKINLISLSFDAQNKEAVYLDGAPGDVEFHIWAQRFFEGYLKIRKVVPVSVVKAGLYKTHFDSYDKIEKIGEGGSGEVHKVKNEKGEIFALKILSKDQKEKRSRFKNELYFSLKTGCPEIVNVVDFGVAGPDEKNSFFYVMKFYERTLRKALPSLVSAQEKLAVFNKILNGVEHAHLKNVWHRDLKPENILCSADMKEVVVADFGIAHFEEDVITEVETKPDSRMANFQYAAPEQRTKGEEVDSSADVYALGLILNEMFTGQIPGGTNYKKIIETHPGYEFLDDLVEKMLGRDPKKRPILKEVKKDLNIKIEGKLSFLRIAGILTPFKKT